jgi:nitroreductase
MKDRPEVMDAMVESAATLAEMAGALIHGRQTILPRRLAPPGPDRRELGLILEAAAAAPDRRSLTPWRFVIVPEPARARLAEVFAASLLQRDPAAAPEQQARAREKAHRAPLLMLAIARFGGDDPEVLPSERLLSAGCAIQNMLLMATALGFGSALTSGKALQGAGLRELFALAPDEQAVCFISIGTVLARKPVRQRPHPASYVTSL